MPRTEHSDVVVVGSGFGGSTAALRLSEKSYRVTVLEAGRRLTDDELPKASWDLRRYLFRGADDHRRRGRGAERLHRAGQEAIVGASREATRMAEDLRCTVGSM